VRAPLRVIREYTKILMEDYGTKIDEDGKTMIRSVMSNTLRMGQLIDVLFNFSRMSKKELEVKETDMTQMATLALKTIKSAHKFPIKANITIYPLLPCNGDENLLEQVFTHLISNALKYSGKTKKPLIEVASYEKDREKIYYVKDNGVGFDMKYYDKLFEVFQRLHTPNEFEGTGVGLALVKRIIKRHGGKVWAEAEPGKGATFYFSLLKNK
jgi:two-component system sensor histidine kinase/response regulator